MLTKLLSDLCDPFLVRRSALHTSSADQEAFEHLDRSRTLCLTGAQSRQLATSPYLPRNLLNCTIFYIQADSQPECTLSGGPRPACQAT
jgi:hypothetical protein